MHILHALGHVGRLVHNPDQHALAGIGNAALEIAAAQVELGHQVTACGFSEPLPAGVGMWRGVEIITLSRSPRARLTSRLDASLLWPLFRQALKAPPVDVLHVHELGLLHLPFGQARVMHIQVPFSADVGKSGLWNKAHAVVCASAFVRDSFLGISPYPPQKTFVVYNGARAAAWDESQIQQLRDSLGISRNKIAILFVGALVRKKGPDVLLRAVRELAARCPALAGRIKVIIAGGTDLWRVKDQDADSFHAELRSLAQGLDVDFLGMVPHHRVLDLYAASDIPVVPSVFPDPHPLVFCEAMAAGRPVVASRTGGIPETAVDGQTGFLFPPGDQDALADILERLIEDPQLRAQMGHAAKERARNFTWQSSAERLDEIYATLLS